MSDTAFIILDIDGRAFLQDCVASVEAQTIAAQRLIVLDNGSVSRVSERLDTGSRFPVEIVRSETNLGFTGGVNEAFRRLTVVQNSLSERPKFVALINNDVVLDPDWLVTVLAAMSDSRVGAVQTVIRRDPLTIDGAGIDVSDGTIRQIGSGIRVGEPLPEAWGVSATAALYRTEALGDRVFDPRFFAYYEDVELCARLHESGWRTIVLPAIKATHRGSQSAARLGGRAQRLRTRNRYLVARLHPGCGRIGALLWEDTKLYARGRASLRGMIDGLLGRVKSEE